MSAGEFARSRVHRIAHLVARFGASLYARAPDTATVTWVAGLLEPAELGVWSSMGRADRAESVGVARRTEIGLAGRGDAGEPCWSAAALLHDAGKQLSGYGTIGRAVVTAVAAVLGERRLRGWALAAVPPGRAPVRVRMGRYVAHDELGAALLRDAGARAEVAAWAGAHHRPECWPSTGIPNGVCRALAAADGERVAG